MDEPDIPMLDVGDFDVLDECVGEDENDDEVISYGSDVDVDDYEEEEDHVNPKRQTESARRKEREVSYVDENSGDNGDNILDVSIDVSENEFLEIVAKDFSENFEDDIKEHPSHNTRLSTKRNQPFVQIKRFDNAKESVVLQRKKPGPKSKTMITQANPAKKPIQKISFADNTEKNQDKTENQENTNIVSHKKIEQDTQNKTPAFLKKGLTDEEIMEHFDEIENTVLTSDNFVIQNDVEEAEKEGTKANSNENENKIDEPQPEQENWDDCEEPKKTPRIKIEREELKESEMWYAEKIKAKENSVEDRFTKLAKIIQYSYPMYKKWLDKNESLFGTAICKVESSKHIPLDQLQPNRWKFLCNKKQIQQSTKEEEKQADSASNNKNTQFSWKIIPGNADANVENTEEYPPFVMRVVKIFEEFLQAQNETEAEAETGAEAKARDGNEVEKAEKDKQVIKTTDQSEADNDKINENDKSHFKNLEGLTLLLRCNRKRDLMMHITGKNISVELMDKIKDLFETGPGKDCNVKSLYCKAIIKEDNLIKMKNTFLFGCETLDDTIGNVKIQLASKSNIWTNLAGVELLANVVAEYLVPTKKTTVLEIGCGTGLMSLLLASKCQKIIGFDVQKEIEEAEIACELNGLKNATFVTGKSNVVMNQINSLIKSLVDNSKAVAVINTNNTLGRSIEVIKSLRKISGLSRIVIITTLTKQAIRSILELTEPADVVHGNPFIPIKACIVDTTPKTFSFEIVMLMERRTMRNLLKVSPTEASNTAPVGLISKSKQVAPMKYSAGIASIPFFNKDVPLKFVKGKPVIPGNKIFPNPSFNPATKFQGKKPFPESEQGFHPGAKRFKPFEKLWQGSSNIRLNPMHDKKGRDDSDLREKLSGGRIEPTALAQEMQEQRNLLNAAKDKLLGAGPSVDVETVKKLQEMLNLAIEKTNKLQSQLPPRSVWDRIAPSDTGLDNDQFKANPPVKSRFIKDTGPKELLITTSNDREYNALSAGTGKSKKYHNLQLAEPNLIMPIANKKLKATQSVVQKPNSAPYNKPGPNRFQSGNYRKQDNQESELWSRNKQPPYQNEPQSKWARSSPPHRASFPRPVRSSPPRRPISPARRPMSPPRRPISPARRPMSPPRRTLSPPRRLASPSFRQHSLSQNPSGRPLSPSRRHDSPSRRPLSPHKYRGESPLRQSRQQASSPRRYADEWDIPNRSAVAESGWCRTDNDDWAGPSSSSSGWNQGSSSNNSNRYREDNKWDNQTAPSSGNNKNSQPPAQSSFNNLWKVPASSSIGAGSSWNGKNDNMIRDSGRHEPRHEPNQESRHESRHETSNETRWEAPRYEKDDYGGLPEDARDPWGDDHPTVPQKDLHWNNASSQPSNQLPVWPREKANENWSTKTSYPMNNIGSGGGGSSNPIQNPNMNMNMGGGGGMGTGMNNSNKGGWQNPLQQQHSSRNTNWLQGNWQAGGGGGGGGNSIGGGLVNPVGGHAGGMLLGNWQQSQPSYGNFPQRPFNNNPYMNNRR